MKAKSKVPASLLSTSFWRVSVAGAIFRCTFGLTYITKKVLKDLAKHSVSLFICMLELEKHLVLYTCLLPIFLGPCCEVFANLNIVRSFSNKQHLCSNRRCSILTPPRVKSTHPFQRQYIIRKRKTKQRHKTLKNTKELTSHPTTMPSSGRARAAARLLAPVKTPMSSTWKVSLTTFYDYHLIILWRPRYQAPEKFLWQLI